MFKGFRLLFARRTFEDSMTDELRFHMEQYAEDLMRSGISREEAKRRARIELGGVNSLKEECREARGLHIFDELGRQLAYAARLLRKSRGFTITALLTLAVCLGANLTIFAVVDCVLLRPLPFPDADRIVTLYNTYPKAGVERDGSSLTNYYERRGHIAAFRSVSIYRYGTAIVGDTGFTNREQITQVSPEFFATLGRGPALGHAFSEAETTYQTDKVAVLTDTFWRQHFNSDPNVLGRQLRVDGTSRTIIGVLPADFRFLSSHSEIYFPLSSNPEQRLPRQRHAGGNSIQMIARLSPGATLAQAQAQIDAQNANLELDDPQAKMIADAGFRSLVIPLHADHVAAIRPTLLLLQTGVFVLLLIGVVNLVNLLLIRANSRAKEFAVRLALGASGGHLVSDVVIETTLLTLMGGLLGLLFAKGGIRLLSYLGAEHLPLGSQISFDARLALVAFLGAIVLGVVLAAPIAWINFRRELKPALQSESRTGTTNRAAQHLRHSFIVAQIALAFVLLAGSGLLAVSLRNVMQVSPGFRAENTLTGQLSLPYRNYPNGRTALAFTERLMGELNQQPGVSASGVVNNVPFSGNSGKSAAAVVGHVTRPGESPRGHYSYGVGGDYFQAMGFTLRAGRFLTESDSLKAARVCVVDDDFARYYWPNVNPIGQRLFPGSERGKESDAFTVVGVVGRVKQAGLTDDEAQGAIYYPFIFRGSNDMFVVARTGLSLESLALTLQRLIRQIDPDVPVSDLQSMQTRISDSLVVQRSPALLAALFSAIALLLTAIGTYGVLSYAVAQRGREIGVRMALGAQPAQIRNQFLSLALRLLVLGTIVGIFGAWLAGQAMQTVLFHIPAFNAPILAVVALIMALVSVLACLLPSQRAARFSPVKALAEQ